MVSNVAPKIILWWQAMDEDKNIYFANFQILGPLGCQGRVVIPQNVKKAKITTPFYHTMHPWRQSWEKEWSPMCARRLRNRLASREPAKNSAQLPGPDRSAGRPKGECTDEFLSRKPGFLLSAIHSHAFRWFSAAPLIFLFLGLLSLQLNQIWRIFCVTYGEEGGWTVFDCLQKL